MDLKSSIIVTSFKENFNYLSLFSETTTIGEIFNGKIKGIFIKIIVKRG